MDGAKDGLKRYRVRINYVDQDGKPRQIERVAYGNAEAKELERKLYEQIKNEAPTARVTFDSLCDDYLVAKKNSVRATTYDKTRRNLELYIRPTLGNLKLDRLTPQRLQTWKNTIDEMDLGLQTKRNIYKELNIVLNWAVKLERIQRTLSPPLGLSKRCTLRSRRTSCTTTLRKNSCRTLLPPMPARIGRITFSSQSHFIPACARERSTP